MRSIYGKGTILATIVLIMILLPQTVLPILQGWAAQYELSVSTSIKEAKINLSSLDPPDTDNPYITLNFKARIEGNVPENPEKPMVLAKASISLEADKGLYIYSDIKPNYQKIPFETDINVKIYRNSELGDFELRVLASSMGVIATPAKIKLSLSRDKIKIALAEPKVDTYVLPDGSNLKVEGSIDKKIAGVVINIDFYHKYPEYSEL